MKKPQKSVLEFPAAPLPSNEAPKAKSLGGTCRTYPLIRRVIADPNGKIKLELATPLISDTKRSFLTSFSNCRMQKNLNVLCDIQGSTIFFEGSHQAVQKVFEWFDFNVPLPPSTIGKEART